MAELIVDMTPTTINRTAIFHIALDTARALEGQAGVFRYGGQYFKAPVTDRNQLDAMREGILNTILGDDGLIGERWREPVNNKPRTASSGKILFFDPLYVLFEGVRRDDVVFVLDLTPVTNPEWHNDRVCELYRIAFRWVAASGAKVAAISRNTAIALWANYGIPVDSITVVPLYLRQGVGAAGEDLPYEGCQSRNLLFVGSLETRKNLTGLFHAFEASGLNEHGYRLVVAGGDGKGADAIKSDAKQIPGIDLRGFVSDEELRTLYRTAAGFVYPSYLEGFGVPILEAASWGLPILTSITGATADVAPPGSLMVDPYDIATIQEALHRMAAIPDEERKAIFEYNRKHAEEFTFSRYLETLKEALNAGE